MMMKIYCKDLGLSTYVYDIQALKGGFVFAGDGTPTYILRMVINYFLFINISSNVFHVLNIATLIEQTLT